MGKVIIQKHTTMHPIQMIGEEAGICYGSDISSEEKNYKRGLQCIKDGHGRTTEFPQVYLIIEGYSARFMRELYTHIGGAPTRLQASTRYIKYGEFDFITPHSIAGNPEALEVYTYVMDTIADGYRQLEDLGIPKEDTANILPYSSVLNKYPISGCFCIAKLFVGSLLRSAGSEYIVNESVRFGLHQPDRIFHKVRSYNNCYLF